MTGESDTESTSLKHEGVVSTALDESTTSKNKSKLSRSK